MLNGPTASTIPSNPARLLRLADLSTDVSDQVLTEGGRAGFGGPMSKSSPFLLRRDSGIPPKLFALGVTRRYGKGELIYQQGQWSTHFYVVVSGRVRIFLTMPDGTERVLCFAESGASFGESACFDCLPYY